MPLKATADRCLNVNNKSILKKLGEIDLVIKTEQVNHRLNIF